jgi:polyhydroxybutyrate depolymerase
MRLRRIVVVAAAIVVGVPVLAGIIATAAFYAIFYFPDRTGSPGRALTADGQRREYLLYVPATYDSSRATPLVISLHPAMSWPSSEMAISRWNRIADERGVLVVYPAGIGSGPKTWFMEGRESPSSMPDVRFIAALMDTLEAAYHIDARRIYADGLSNGGGMAFVLSCTLADRIAAIGMVAAARSVDWPSCAEHRPVPSIAFHGTADPVAPYGGGSTPVGPDRFPAVVPFTETWARRNGCISTPLRSAVTRSVTLLSWAGCADSATVELFTVEGGGHQWPGGHPLPGFLVGWYTDGIDATRLEWAFFEAHPLPALSNNRSPAF